MIKTPVQKLIDGFKNMKADTLMRGGVNDYTKVAAAAFDKSIEHAQSLLPVEQQMMCDRNVKFIEWVQYEGYYCEQANPFYWRKSEHDAFYTTTELLQLFTNQNEPNGK